MISCFPALVASVHHGSVRTPRADLGHIANYLWMLTGSEDPEVARALEVYCTLTIDHGFNSGVRRPGDRLHRRRSGRLRARCVQR
ncbi:MAG: citrate/2-methylcitrate synthase [Acidimicrobiales bacterium]